MREINLSDNQFINDCIFQELIECFPAVSSIVLDGCKIYCTQYDSGGGSPSPSRWFFQCQFALCYLLNFVFEFENLKLYIVEFFIYNRLTSRCLISVISSRAKQVKKLSFKNCSLEASALRRLGEVPDLSLEDLDLSRCSGIGQDSILDFCRHQNKLVKLNIDLCRRILVTFQ